MAGCQLEIKAIPHAQKNEVVGWLGVALKVKIHASPVKGKANKELCAFLAETLSLPKNSVRLLQGESSQKKIIQINGLSREEVAAAFSF
jgi:uncharacterized protein